MVLEHRGPAGRRARLFQGPARSAAEGMAQSPALEAVSEYLPNAAGDCQVNGVFAPGGAGASDRTTEAAGCWCVCESWSQTLRSSLVQALSQQGLR